MHDRKDDVRDVGLEALGNKASPRERCPRGQRRRCLAQAVQAWMDSNEKTARGRDPRTQESKRAQPTAGEKSIPNSREKNWNYWLIRNSATIEKIVKMPGEEWEFFRAVQRQ